MMNRRIFLSKSAIGVAALSLPLGSCNSKPIYDPGVLAEPLDLSKIWDTETIEKIGALYRKQFPRESERTLVREIGEDTFESIAKKIEADFQSGNTIMLDGWTLAMTEARQCALFSINESK